MMHLLRQRLSATLPRLCSTLLALACVAAAARSLAASPPPEPLMIVFLGVVVGGMVIAMYLPIFDMVNAAG